jgi:hypothetical protein
VEFTMTSTRVSVAGWAAAASSGDKHPFLEPSVHTKSCQFKISTPFVRVNVSSECSWMGICEWVSGVGRKIVYACGVWRVLVKVARRW